MIQSIKLPYPPSANRYWRRSGRHIHKSDEARAYQHQVKKIAIYNNVREYAGDLAVTLHVHRPERRGDLDNYIKVLLDALKGVAYQDDKQITVIHARRSEAPKTAGWVMVTVEGVGA